LIGFFVDRWGARWLMFIGAIFTGSGLIFLSRTTSLGSFYGGFVLIAFGMSFCSPAVMNPVASNWFRRHLGLAMGVLATGFALGGLQLPLVIKLIDSFGWRQALFILGICVFVICLPLTFVVRYKPEKYGYGPDGDPLRQAPAVVQENSLLPLRSAEVEIGTKQALKSRTFWYITIAFTFQFTTTGVVLTHIMPYLNSIQIDRVAAGLFATAFPIVSIIGRLGSGWLSDRISKKQTAIVSFGMLSLGTLLFSYVSSDTLWLLILSFILLSIAYGCTNTLRAVLLREYFGRTRFGTIFGFLLGIISLGAIVGPFVAGWIFDISGGYRDTWLILTALNVASVVIMIITPRIRVPAAVASGA
jgi:MFS transporter, OFA family, oxalate/formate antiporter